jgi:hypothetical protein
MKLRSFFISSLIVLFFGGISPCDTFTNKTTGRILNGYLTSRIEDGNTIAYTVQNGRISIKPTDWNITADRIGRKQKVIIISFEGDISLQIMVESLLSAISEAVNDGPLFVVLEMNSPGGRASYIERICDKIIRTDYCPVVAFIKTGPYGGAVSGTAAIAMACDKIFMSAGTTIGSASIIDPSHAFVSEKLSIAWQEYIGTLARRNGRPETLARAMVDKDLEIVEVTTSAGQMFVERSQVEPNQVIVRTWTQAGSLLTLTAAEAVDCGIAESLADRADVLNKLDAVGVEIKIDDSADEAVRTFRKAKLKFTRLRNTLDANIRRIEKTENLEEAINLLREIREDYKSLLLLAKRYPDLYLDIELIEEQLDSANDYYEKAKAKKRTLAGDANEKTNLSR